MQVQAHPGPAQWSQVLCRLWTLLCGSCAAPGGLRELMPLAREVGQKSGVLPAPAENLHFVPSIPVWLLTTAWNSGSRVSDARFSPIQHTLTCTCSCSRHTYTRSEKHNKIFCLKGMEPHGMPCHPNRNSLPEQGGTDLATQPVNPAVASGLLRNNNALSCNNSSVTGMALLVWWQWWS